MARIMLNKDNCRIERADMYLVDVIMTDGSSLKELEPRRLFPLSDLEHYITLLDDSEHEVAFITNMSDIDAESQQAIRECFKDYYMIPKILEVLQVRDKFGALKFKVRTERGIVEFRIRSRHSDIKLFRSGRVIMRDSNDNRYEISNFDALDKRSKKLLFSYT